MKVKMEFKKVMLVLWIIIIGLNLLGPSGVTKLEYGLMALVFVMLQVERIYYRD